MDTCIVSFSDLGANAVCSVKPPRTLDAVRLGVPALSVNQQANLTNEIGSGPFVVKSFQTGVSYTLVKRRDYNWGPAALGHTGQAYLDSITYKVVADESTREQVLVAGDAQADFNVTPTPRRCSTRSRRSRGDKPSRRPVKPRDRSGNQDLYTERTAAPPLRPGVTPILSHGY